MNLKNTLRTFAPVIAGLNLFLGTNIHAGEMALPGFEDYSIEGIGGYIVANEDLPIVKALAMERAGEPGREYTEGRYGTYLVQVLRDISPEDIIVSKSEIQEYISRTNSEN